MMSSGPRKVGDIVRIIECRPMSKLKRWRLEEVLRKAVQVAAEPTAVDLGKPMTVDLRIEIAAR